MGERGRPERAFQSFVAEVTKALMPQIARGRGGEGMMSACGGRRGQREELVVLGVTSEDHPPRSSILDGKAKVIKLHIYRVITCKLFDGNEVFDEVRGDEYIVEGER